MIETVNANQNPEVDIGKSLAAIDIELVNPVGPDGSDVIVAFDQCPY